MADSLSVREVLVRARARIDTPEKWVKCDGTYDMPDMSGGGTCAVFAISCVSVSEDEEADKAVHAAAIDCLCEAAGVADRNAFYEWHDAPERSHGQVLAAFDAAISLAEKPEAIRV